VPRVAKASSFTSQQGNSEQFRRTNNRSQAKRKDCDTVTLGRSRNPNHPKFRKQHVLHAIQVAVAVSLLLAAAGFDFVSAGGEIGIWNVRQAGARGDGLTDETALFQNLLDEAEKAGGGIVQVPAGRYRIEGTLKVPANVRLEGIYRFSPTTQWGRQDDLPGSVLLALANRGNPTGEPFIRLVGRNASVAGLVIAYPEVTSKDVPPTPYPPCIAAEGVENISVQDCLLLNPYEGIRLVRAARHLIRNVMGYPIARGIYVDECYDIGRIENIHFWPFGVHYRPEDPFCRWINLHGIAFEFARTDWHYVHNTFCFGYGVGYKFSESEHGSANGNFLGIGADCCERAVLVEQCQPPGLLITNGEFVGRWGSRSAVTLEIRPKVTGLVSLVNCSFWGPIDRCVSVESKIGQLVLSACHFCEWDVGMQGSAAVELLGGRAILQGCTFQQEGRWAVRIGPQVESVVLSGVQAKGRFFLQNQAPERTTIQAVPTSLPQIVQKARTHYRIHLGEPGDDHFLLLWHGREKGERPFRWSCARSFLLLPITPGEEQQVIVEAAVPAHLPAGSFCLYLGEQKLAELRTGKTELTVPAQPADEICLEIRGPGWVPAQRDPRSRDARILGVQVFAVTVRSSSLDEHSSSPALLNQK